MMGKRRLKWEMMAEHEIDLSEFTELGIQVRKGKKYKIMIAKDLHPDREAELAQEFATRGLSVDGHLYVPPKNDGIGQDTQQLIDFLGDKSETEDVIMFDNSDRK